MTGWVSSKSGCVQSTHTHTSRYNIVYFEIVFVVIQSQQPLILYILNCTPVDVRCITHYTLYDSHVGNIPCLCTKSIYVGAYREFPQCEHRIPSTNQCQLLIILSNHHYLHYLLRRPDRVTLGHIKIHSTTHIVFVNVQCNEYNGFMVTQRYILLTANREACGCNHKQSAKYFEYCNWFGDKKITQT